MKSKIEKIRELLGGGRVITDPAVLSAYASAGLVKGYEPACAVKVKDGFEIEKLVRLANEVDIKLIPVSTARDHRNGGTVPAVKDAVMVDLSEMKNIYDADRTFRMAIIDAGVTYEELIPALKEKGLMIDMPLAPKAGKSVVASLLETEARLNPNMQWNVLDPLRATEVIWGDGNRMRTGEAAGMPLNLGTKEMVEFAHEKRHQYLINQSGPDTIDYYRLLSGAQGTMGIVPWVSVKCALLPDLREAYLVPAEKLEYGIEFMYQMEHLRCGDGLFMMNAKDLAALMAQDAADAARIEKLLPAWTVMVVLASRPPLPELRIKGQRECMEQAAAAACVCIVKQLAGFRAEEIMEKAFAPCKEGAYWKNVETGSSADIFFLCTMDRVHEFTEIMKSEAEKAGYPAEALGIYIQPKHQGVSCRLEFRIPYCKDCRAAAEKLFADAPKALFEQGAFFSRPYGNWADIQLPEDKGTTDRLRRLKKIFDPNNVLSPGRLSDWGAKQ